jgi:hypothetical protein
MRVWKPLVVLSATLIVFAWPATPATLAGGRALASKELLERLDGDDAAPSTWTATGSPTRPSRTCRPRPRRHAGMPRPSPSGRCRARVDPQRRSRSDLEAIVQATSPRATASDELQSSRAPRSRLPLRPPKAGVSNKGLEGLEWRPVRPTIWPKVEPSRSPVRGPGFRPPQSVEPGCGGWSTLWWRARDESGGGASPNSGIAPGGLGELGCGGKP